MLMRTESLYNICEEGQIKELKPTKAQHHFRIPQWEDGWEDALGQWVVEKIGNRVFTYLKKETVDAQSHV